MDPSFKKFDYLLRTNKAIERKLLFDVVAAARQKLDLSQAWYLGLGSMWFGDFKIAHRALAINDMYSIEHAQYAERARWNRPFSTIRVLAGECNQVLSTQLPLALWDRPMVAWLDYDKLVSESVREDLDALLSKAAPNSVVAITVNAYRKAYKPDPMATSGPKTVVGVVASFLGSSAIPAEYQPQLAAGKPSNDVSASKFPAMLAEALLIYMAHRLTSLTRTHNGSVLSFVPLFSFHHIDGVDMITVGGAVTTDADSVRWHESRQSQPLLCNDAGDLSHCVLNLIPYTVKEKLALDALLPARSSPTQFLAAARTAGIKLDPDEIEMYRRYYRQYPVFLETTV